MTAPAGGAGTGTGGARVLAVRLDSDGDVLLTGPAISALRSGADGAPAERLDVLASPQGAAAARLLPDVDDVLVVEPAWAGYAASTLEPGALGAVVERLRGRRYTECVIFTSYHQSALPAAMLARMAGIGSVAGVSADHPGTLLDLRHRRPLTDAPAPGSPAGVADPSADPGTGGPHEVLAALSLVAATGRAVPAEPRLALRAPLPDVSALLGGPAARRPPPGARSGYVVVHPGASVPARAPAPEVAAAAAAALAAVGWAVVVTGGPAETGLGARVAAAAPGALDLSGRTDLAQLAAVLAGAAAAVVGNTGPAHLAAAVGTPVASLFAPVVPAERWAPWGVPVVLLGDRAAPCAHTRARTCPVPGHPCLRVDPQEVVRAVDQLAGTGQLARTGQLPGTGALVGSAAGAAPAGGPS